MFRSSSVALSFVLLLVTSAQLSAADANWPRWRGPGQAGHSSDADLPLKWNADLILWKTALPGEGYSSPVTWGDRVFLTSALERGRERVVFCVDRKSGKLLWQHVAWTGEPEKTHRMNGHASATCVTDGERVYAFFGRGGLHCYTVAGKHVWSKDLGRFEGPWGTAACPVLVGDILIQNCDSDADSYIVGLDKKTGEQVWRTPRDETRGWSTPVLVSVDGHEELVLNGDRGVRGYNPKTGEALWFCSSYIGRGTPTVTPAGGLMIAMNGKRGDIYAVKPGGRGDVSESRRAWHVPRTTGRDIGSPIVIDDYMLVMSLKPFTIACYQASTGKELWIERVDGAQCSSTPIAYRGHAVFIQEGGKAIVVKPGPTPAIVAENVLGETGDEIFRASITPSEGTLLIRSDKTLYCVGEGVAGK